MLLRNQHDLPRLVPSVGREANRGNRVLIGILARLGLLAFRHP